MKQYHITWEIPKINKIHDYDGTFDDIESIFVYVYNMWASDAIPELLYGMNKGQTASYNFPGTDESITITALESTFLPF